MIAQTTILSLARRRRPPLHEIPTKEIPILQMLFEVMCLYQQERRCPAVCRTDQGILLVDIHHPRSKTLDNLNLSSMGRRGLGTDASPLDRMVSLAREECRLERKHRWVGECLPAHESLWAALG